MVFIVTRKPCWELWISTVLAIPHFKSLKDQQAAAGLKTDKVCCHADGRDVSPEYVSRIVPKLSKSCGLPRAGAHDMRRTAASLLIAKGATAQQAQECLGHEDITTTMNIYTRCFNETKRHTSEIMNSIYADWNLCALDALLDAFHNLWQIVQKANRSKSPRKRKKDPKTCVFESLKLVREAGLEPARPEWALEPESSESANSTTRANF